MKCPVKRILSTEYKVCWMVSHFAANFCIIMRLCLNISSLYTWNFMYVDMLTFWIFNQIICNIILRAMILLNTHIISIFKTSMYISVNTASSLCPLKVLSHSTCSWKGVGHKSTFGPWNELESCTVWPVCLFNLVSMYIIKGSRIFYCCGFLIGTNRLCIFGVLSWWKMWKLYMYMVSNIAYMLQTLSATWHFKVVHRNFVHVNELDVQYACT